MTTDETTDREHFYLGDTKLERDLTPDELEEEIAQFKEDFEEYEDLAGDEINIPDSERTIKPTSPLIEAKSKLLPAKWSEVKTSEWSKRTLSPYFVIQDMQAEHHANLQRLEDLQDKAFAYLYFFPKGYVEKAVIHLGVSAGDYEVDTSQTATTITTVPNEGFANTDTEHLEWIYLKMKNVVRKDKRKKLLAFFEALIALGMITTIVIEVIGSQGNIANLTGYSRRSSEAIGLAESVMAQVEYNWKKYQFKELKNLTGKDKTFEFKDQADDFDYTYDLQIIDWKLDILTFSFQVLFQEQQKKKRMMDQNQLEMVVFQ